MIVAPPLDPPGEAPKAIQMEASGLVEEVLDVGHKVQWTGLLDLQGFLLVLEEEVKELFLDPGPVFLNEIVYTKLVVDLQNMFKVFSPPTTAIVCHQSSRVPEGGPFPASPLRLGSLRCWWRRWWWEAPPTRCQFRGQTTLLTLPLHTCHPWCTSWVTNRAAAMPLPSHCRPSVVLRCATRGGGFICGGVSNGSPPCRSFWRLHHLLVWCGRLLWAWLSDRHHLGHTRHHRGQRWHSLGQSAWAG